MTYLNIHTTPRARSVTLSIYHPLPRIITCTLLLTTITLALRYMYYREWGVLKCTRHPNNNPHQLVEDNDCSITRTLRPVHAVHSPEALVIGEFNFELAGVQIACKHGKRATKTAEGHAELNDWSWYGFDVNGGIRKIEKRRVERVIDREEVHEHYNLYLKDGGVMGVLDLGVEEMGVDTVSGIRKVEGGHSSRFESHTRFSHLKSHPSHHRFGPALTTVYLESNDGRLYPFFNYHGKEGKVKAVEVGRKINNYKERARVEGGKKISLKVEEGEGGWGLKIAVIMAVVGIGSVWMKGWEEVVFDADMGTLTIKTGRSVYLGRFRGVRNSSVVSLDNVVRGEVRTRKWIEVGRGGGKKIEYAFLEIRMAGLGVGRTGNQRGYESSIEFGATAATEKAEMKSAAEAINTCLASFSGVAFSELMDEEGGAEGDVPEGNKESDSAGFQVGAPQRRKVKVGAASCVVCMSKTANVVFFPCKHMRCCAGCSERVELCPICRVRVDEKVFVYV